MAECYLIPCLSLSGGFETGTEVAGVQRSSGKFFDLTETKCRIENKLSFICVINPTRSFEIRRSHSRAVHSSTYKSTTQKK